MIISSPKPTIDNEIKKSIAKSKEIYPQKKPYEKEDLNQNETIQSVSENTEKKEDIFIYPKEKPIIVKKIIKKPIIKSEIFSKRDFKIANF